MSNQTPKLHFVLVPLPAQGHTIPMIDLAHLLADRGATVTLITTPANATRIKGIIDRVSESGIPIRFVSLRFPSAEVGLPDGCENIDTLPSVHLLQNFVEACVRLREPLAIHLRQQKSIMPASCIISDPRFHWAHEMARELGIPSLTFNTFGCSSLLCRHMIRYQNIVMENSSCFRFVVPGLPPIELTRAQSPIGFGGPELDAYRKKAMDEELTADGIIVNSFEDLEPCCFEHYRKITGKKVWSVGPLSLYQKDVADMVLRGNAASVDSDYCLKWLDTKEPASVIYVSFGSVASTPLSQVIEIGLGLEISGFPFVWVIKSGNMSSEVEKWLAEGFEERIGTRGLVIHGWAPQLMILSHSATGGFMTHCGWNSTLESLSAGVPMVTWPHFVDQFLNEKLAVEVLGVGIGVGVTEQFRWGEEHDEVLVSRDDVAKAVCRLMGEGKEAMGMRERARVMRDKAKAAMENGGSSYDNVTSLINSIQTPKMIR